MFDEKVMNPILLTSCFCPSASVPLRDLRTRLIAWQTLAVTPQRCADGLHSTTNMKLGGERGRPGGW